MYLSARSNQGNTVPIYYCIQQSLQHDVPFSWSVVQPISLNLAKLPHIIDEVAQEREETSHIKLFHHNGHIDVIVSLENGKCILKHQDSQEKITQMLSTF